MNQLPDNIDTQLQDMIERVNRQLDAGVENAGPLLNPAHLPVDESAPCPTVLIKQLAHHATN